MRKGWLAQCRLGVLLLASFAAWGRVTGAEGFLRGDTDLSGRLTVSDAIRVLRHLFAADATAVPCEDAADMDDDGKIDVSDAASMLQFIFGGGPAPLSPFPTCGPDGTDDGLGCGSPRECDPMFRYWDIDFEGGCVVWVIDASPTFDSRGLRGVQEATVKAITDLPRDSEFALLFFDKNVKYFPVSGLPAPATPELKATGIAYVNSIAMGSGTCGKPALLLAITYALRSSASVKAILYVSDGGGTCPGSDSEEDYLNGTVEEVTNANAGRVKLHTVELGQGLGIQEPYMRALAERNGGSYHSVQ